MQRAVAQTVDTLERLARSLQEAARPSDFALVYSAALDRACAVALGFVFGKGDISAQESELMASVLQPLTAG